MHSPFGIQKMGSQKCIEIIGPTRPYFVPRRLVGGIGYHGHQMRVISGILVPTSGTKRRGPPTFTCSVSVLNPPIHPSHFQGPLSPLQACHTKCPAGNVDQALLAMGALDKRDRVRERGPDTG